MRETAKTALPLYENPDAVLLRVPDIIRYMHLPRSVATLNKPQRIGCVSIDSGAVAIVDPCHLEVSDGGSVRLPAWNHYTAVDTESGDGELTVYEQRDYRGKLRRVIIEFD